MENSFRNTIRVSHSLDPDQTRHFIGSDLGPNCLPSQHCSQNELFMFQDAWPGAVEMYRNATKGKKDVKITVDTENYLPADV